MTELKSIASPAIHVEDRAHEADHPSSLVAKFGLDQPLKLDFLWAGLCLVGAVYFVFRSR